MSIVEGWVIDAATHFGYSVKRGFSWLLNKLPHRSPMSPYVCPKCGRVPENEIIPASHQPGRHKPLHSICGRVLRRGGE